MNNSQVLALLLCERLVFAPGVKPTLHGVFDSVELSGTSEDNRIFYVFYKARSVQSGTLELKVVGPGKREVARWTDNWPRGDFMVQSCWAFTLDKFKQNGIYTFELWDGPAHRLAYTELDVKRM